MQLMLRSVLALAACAALAVAVRAQAPAPPPPPPDGPRYVVSYMEVKPTAAAEAEKLVRQFRDATRKEAGNLRAEALQRIGQPQSLRAARDVEGPGGRRRTLQRRPRPPSSATRSRRSRMRPSTTACISRCRSGRRVKNVKSTGAAVAVVTHVDVIPPQRENGTAITKQLAEDSRKEKGNLRFEAVTQVNRQNHFTVIEVWRGRKAADTHSMAAHTRAFRDKLAPATGALYDERFYRFMN